MRKSVFHIGRRMVALALACTLGFSGWSVPVYQVEALTSNIEDTMEFGTMKVSGGGFVSGIVTGESCMYARTDVGGAYRYNYETESWEQMLGFLGEEDRGLLSVDAMCIDPNDDNTIFMLCGCAYFSDAKTVIFRSKDGGKTFDEIDVTDLIQVHGNGYGRQFGEAIAIDPDNSNVIYCGGDTQGLIKSTDGGNSWEYVEGYNNLGLFTYDTNWPTWTEHVVKATSDEYASSNGVSSIVIVDGKVYVATSVQGVTNVHVADTSTDAFEPLDASLPTEYLPAHLTVDADNNVLISYVKGISFDGSAGGAYRYNTTTKEVTDISPIPNGKEASVGIGCVVSDPDDANTLVATSCGLWWGQSWEENAWENNKVCYGDITFKSTDGGQTWETMAAGQGKSWNGPLSADYPDDNGCSWIRNKAIHWSGAIAIDPKDNDRFLVTSGNGVFEYYDVWSELPKISFHADGIEEVVSLDATSAPDGTFYSVIGDYDGFVHESKDSSYQYSPTMDTVANNSSCGAVAYCPSNPEVMVRYSENASGAFYSMDGGETWTQLPCSISGGKAAINQLADGSYRIFRTGSGRVYYTDDFGATWSEASGTKGSSNLWVQVDEENPQYVYAYGYYYNQYHGKDEPTIEDAYYTLMVSDDYGKTFTDQTICMYDQCDSAYRIAYLGEGEFVLAAGYYGAYYVSDYGSEVNKLDTVDYCKTIGYGAPEKEGGINTLYMWGRPESDDKQGVYRSVDGGETWVAVDLEHTYGGTGNGNYIVGDKKEFGTFYMSTVGCGIVYGQLKDGNSDSDDNTETPSSSTTSIKITTTEHAGEDTTGSSEDGENTTAQAPGTSEGDVTTAGTASTEDNTGNTSSTTAQTPGTSEGDTTTAGAANTEDNTGNTSSTTAQTPATSEGDTTTAGAANTEDNTGNTSSTTAQTPGTSEGDTTTAGAANTEDNTGNASSTTAQTPATSEGDTTTAGTASTEDNTGNTGTTTEQTPGTSENPSQEVKVTGIALTDAKWNAIEGETKTLQPVISPSNATNPAVEYKTSDASVATVDAKGTITAFGEGTATITVTTVDGGYYATCTVTVSKENNKTAVDSIQLDRMTASVQAGDKLTLNATVYPEDADNKEVLWISSDSTIADVTQAGVVEAKQAGVATITAITKDGSKEASCIVVVTEAFKETKVESVSINLDTIDIYEGVSAQLIATITPDNATNQQVSWSSSNSNVAMVDTNGKITAIQEGIAVITVTTKDQGKTATCTVNVKKQDSTIAVTDIMLDSSQYSMELGEVKKLEPVISPADATNKQVNWYSNNENVVEVSADGTLKAVGEGSAMILVSTVEGGKVAMAMVQVGSSQNDTISVDNITINPYYAQLKPGETLRLSTVISPANATNQEIIWLSEDSTIATVENGVVQAKAEGTVVITAMSKDNNRKAYCAIIVKEEDDSDIQTGGNQSGDNTTQSGNQSGDNTTQSGNNGGQTATTQDAANSGANGNNQTATTQNSAGTTQAPAATTQASNQNNSAATTQGSSNATGTSQDDQTAATVTKPAKVTGIKLKKLSSKKVRLTWKKVSGASGYKVYQYNIKKKKYTLVKTTKATKLTVKKVKNKKFRFKVKAYKKTADGIINGF